MVGFSLLIKKKSVKFLSRNILWTFFGTMSCFYTHAVAPLPVAFTAQSNLPANVGIREAMRRFAHDSSVTNPAHRMGGFVAPALPTLDALEEVNMLNKSDLADTLNDFNAAFLLGVGHCSTVAITQVYAAPGGGFDFYTSVLSALFVSGIIGGVAPLAGVPYQMLLANPAVGYFNQIRHSAQLRFTHIFTFPSPAPGLFSHSEQSIKAVLRNRQLPVIPGIPAGNPIGIMLHAQNVRRACLHCYNHLFTRNRPRRPSLARYLSAHPRLDGVRLRRRPFLGIVTRATLAANVAASGLYGVVPPPAPLPLLGGLVVSPLVGAARVFVAAHWPLTARGKIKKDEFERGR